MHGNVMSALVLSALLLTACAGGVPEPARSDSGVAPQPKKKRAKPLDR